MQLEYKIHFLGHLKSFILFYIFFHESQNVIISIKFGYLHSATSESELYSKQYDML